MWESVTLSCLPKANKVGLAKIQLDLALQNISKSILQAYAKLPLLKQEKHQLGQPELTLRHRYPCMLSLAFLS